MNLNSLIKKLYGDQRIRFLFVGGINTIVGYGSYAFIIFIGIDAKIAVVISNIAGIINSYFWNKYFTFRKPKKSFGELIRFISVYAVSFLLNIFMIAVLVDRLGINEYIAGVICIVFTTLISYFGHRFFSFKKSL